MPSMDSLHPTSSCRGEVSWNLPWAWLLISPTRMPAITVPRKMRRAAERQRALQESSRGKLGVTELLMPQVYDGTGGKEGSKEWEEWGSGLSSVKSLTEPDFLLLPAGARCPVILLLQLYFACESCENTVCDSSGTIFVWCSWSIPAPRAVHDKRWTRSEWMRADQWAEKCRAEFSSGSPFQPPMVSSHPDSNVRPPHLAQKTGVTQGGFLQLLSPLLHWMDACWQLPLVQAGPMVMRKVMSCWSSNPVFWV